MTHEVVCPEQIVKNTEDTSEL